MPATTIVKGRKKIMVKVPSKKVKITKTVSVKPMKDTAKAQVISLMRKMISRSEETKMRCSGVWAGVQFNSAISGVADCYKALPDVVDGTANFNRIGERIKPKALVLRGTVAINYTQPNSIAPEVHLFVVSHKSKKSYSALNAASGAGYSEIVDNLYDFGNGTNGPFDGTVPPTLYPLNTKTLRILAHKKLDLAVSTQASTSNRESSSDRRQRRFTIKLKVPSVLTYDESIDTSYPTNYAPVLMLGFTYPDGQSPSVIVTPVLASCTFTLLYDDA